MLKLAKLARGDTAMPSKEVSQDGINMVDLMMWLVIAALLLAAAIQGIGYYQKAAYLYTLKENLQGAGSYSMKAATNSGDLTVDTITEGTSDTTWNDGVTYQVIDPAGRVKPYIRASHSNVIDVDGIYLFEECGDTYKIGVNIIPKEGTPMLEACGIESGEGDGGGGGSSTPTAPVYALSYQCGTHTVGMTQQELDWADGTLNAAGGWSYTVYDDTTTPGVKDLYFSSAATWDRATFTSMTNNNGFAFSRVTGDNASCLIVWVKDGKYHNESGPASENFAGTFKTSESWYINQILHRVGGPASTAWSPTTQNKTSETWSENGQRHRIDGPAYQTWTASGVRTRSEWDNRGQHHRLDGPAIEVWNTSGTKTTEEWKQNHKHHRTDGPALRTWTTAGVISRETWYNDGIAQRRITYDTSGQPSYQEWYASNGTTVERREDYPPTVSATTPIWQSVDTSSDGQKVLAGASTHSWRSDNGGTSFAQMTSNAAWSTSGAGGGAWDTAVSANGNLMFLGQRLTSGESNMYRSTDGGNTWGKVSALGTTGQWAFTDTSVDGTKVVTLNTAAATGRIHISRDSGATWTAAPVPSTGGWWKSVTMTDDGNTLYASTAGTTNESVHVSRDGGATWALTSLPSLQYWSSVTASPDGKTVLAFTTGGAGHRSTDSGATWSPITVAASGFTSPSAPVFSENGMRLIIGGGAAFSKTYYTSSDAGATWQVRSELPTSTNWRNTPNITPDGSKIIAFHPTEGYKTFPF